MVACYSKGVLALDHIQEVADDSRKVHAVACGSLDGLVGKAMVHDVMDGLDLPCIDAEVVDFRNG